MWHVMKVFLARWKTIETLAFLAISSPFSFNFTCFLDQIKIKNASKKAKLGSKSVCYSSK